MDEIIEFCEKAIKDLEELKRDYSNTLEEKQQELGQKQELEIYSKLLKQDIERYKANIKAVDLRLEIYKYYLKNNKRGA